VSEEKPYQLVPSSMPERKKRTSVYEEIIKDFLDQGGKTTLVVYGDKSENTLYQGLYQARRRLGRTDIRIFRRDGEVYLTTED